jgi:hypothetical protein
MTAGRDVTGNAFDKWLLPVQPHATAERDRRRAATCQADTEEANGHLLARPGRRRPSKPAAVRLRHLTRIVLALGFPGRPPGGGIRIRPLMPN